MALVFPVLSAVRHRFAEDMPVSILARLPVRWLALALVPLLLVATHGLWLSALGDQLVAADTLEPADAIIVLAGTSPARSAHGLALYQAGHAPRLIVSDEPVRTHGLTTTWSELHRHGLASLPVPDDALLILPVSLSTYEEALRSRDLMLREGFRSAILVTDRFHSRRASLVFRHVLEPAGLSLRVSPTADPDGDVNLWWQDEQKSQAVVSEYIKFVYYLVRGRLL